jgi:hypothetical protein
MIRLEAFPKSWRATGPLSVAKKVLISAYVRSALKPSRKSLIFSLSLSIDAMSVTAPNVLNITAIRFPLASVTIFGARFLYSTSIIVLFLSRSTTRIVTNEYES